jgi:hypothetical protein
MPSHCIRRAPSHRHRKRKSLDPWRRRIGSRLILPRKWATVWENFPYFRFGFQRLLAANRAISPRGKGFGPSFSASQTAASGVSGSGVARHYPKTRSISRWGSTVISTSSAAGASWHCALFGTGARPPPAQTSSIYPTHSIASPTVCIGYGAWGPS